MYEICNTLMDIHCETNNIGRQQSNQNNIIISDNEISFVGSSKKLMQISTHQQIEDQEFISSTRSSILLASINKGGSTQPDVTAGVLDCKCDVPIKHQSYLAHPNYEYNMQYPISFSTSSDIVSTASAAANQRRFIQLPPRIIMTSPPLGITANSTLNKAYSRHQRPMCDAVPLQIHPMIRNQSNLTSSIEFTSPASPRHCLYMRQFQWYNNTNGCCYNPHHHQLPTESYVLRPLLYNSSFTVAVWSLEQQSSVDTSININNTAESSSSYEPPQSVLSKIKSAVLDVIGQLKRLINDLLCLDARTEDEHHYLWTKRMETLISMFDGRVTANTVPAKMKQVEDGVDISNILFQKQSLLVLLLNGLEYLRRKFDLSAIQSTTSHPCFVYKSKSISGCNIARTYVYTDENKYYNDESFFKLSVNRNCDENAAKISLNIDEISVDVNKPQLNIFWKCLIYLWPKRFNSTNVYNSNSYKLVQRALCRNSPISTNESLKKQLLQNVSNKNSDFVNHSAICSSKAKAEHRKVCIRHMHSLQQFRPIFTYWITTIQVVVLFISLLCYSFGPFGFNWQFISGQVLDTSLNLHNVQYLQIAHFWIGPKANDLIHLGANFAPCMRADKTIFSEMDKIRRLEKESACCIRKDDTGCVQASQQDCALWWKPSAASMQLTTPLSSSLSLWRKWTSNNVGPDGRTSGSVCGLDPNFCDTPASAHPNEWPDDITQWPICRKTNIHQHFLVDNKMMMRSSANNAILPKHAAVDHMECEVLGHPCCIGNHGTCRITTREYCDFVEGSFHEEASLCSQVACLSDVCGMIPFHAQNAPDQFYRLWMSLFLHAGIIPLSVTLFVQYWLMATMEQVIGSARIAIIYIGSGVIGNLASVVLLPYEAHVGPTASHFGLLACGITGLIAVRHVLAKRTTFKVVLKFCLVALVLFGLGCLPWIDNYAHLFAFLFGVPLTFILLPFVKFGVSYTRKRRILTVWISLLGTLIAILVFILLFYVYSSSQQLYNVCEWCMYLNCVPFLRRNVCDWQQLLNLTNVVRATV